MELRPELMPPTVDEKLVARLARLAAEINGARRGEWNENLREFNQLAGTDFDHKIFQGIYGVEL